MTGPPPGQSESRSGFVGRSSDLLALDALLDNPDVRLVTITGTGGVGKTRLAQALIDRPDHARRSGFVGLADVEDAALIPATILRRLGLEASPGQALEEAVAAHLAERRMLLVLDNLEHLAAASSVRDLLDRCPDLQILATSRVPLGLPGEHRHRLAPFEVPDRGSESALGAAVVKLFADRLRHVLPGYRVTDANVDDVVDICREVDGLPLGIELAAAQCRQHAPHVVASRLRERAVLAGRAPASLPVRHRTMRSTLGWSVSLLEPATARLWRALGVFEGGFTLETGETVAAAIGVRADELPGRLDELEAHELVRLGANSLGEPRYEMLRVAREVAFAEAQDDPAYAAILGAHADAFARCCADARPGLMGSHGAT